MFEEAKARDAEEDKLYGKDRRGDEMPDECATKEERLKLLREAKARLEAEAAAEVCKPEQGRPGVRRGAQQQDPRHPAAQLRPTRRGLSASKSADLHA